ncbi:hypothetical protein L798_08332 [Zootermopsis nevadensis]|uniref:Gustatory receptor n=1 Tax=Zootermopsis nevadensis TaxID=136037 RepID=A0A067REQ0_ZOONE|nr:hypothetical protein L798_08332 [Zootermopsis nevadensis]
MPEDIYGAIRPLYYLSKIFGLAPFSFVAEVHPDGLRSNRLKTTYIDVFYSVLIIVISLTASATVLSWRIQNSYATDKHMTIILTDANVFCLNSSLALVSVLLGVAFNTRRMTKLVNEISRIDKILLTRPRDVYKKTYIFGVLQVAYLFCTYVLFYYYHSWVWVGELSSKNFKHLPISYFIRSVIYVMETQYINLIILFRHRFREINTYLKQIYDNDKGDLVHKIELIYFHNSCALNEVSGPSILSQSAYVPITTRRSNHSRSFETKISIGRYSTSQHQLLLMTGIHYALCDMADCVNSMYGLQILVDFTVSFITLTTCIYFCIRFIIQIHLQSEISESEGITRAIGISVVWLTLVIIRLVAITASCSATTAEANYTAQVLQRILLEPGLHPHAMRNAQLFLQQVTNRPLHFTAWGFFIINYNLLGSIIATVATYLVILLQF